MDFEQVKAMARSGLEFFSDPSNEYFLVIPGGITFQDGREIISPEERVQIFGTTRKPTFREVDGANILANDILGIFQNDTAISNGDFVEINGERFIVAGNRGVQPTKTPIAYRPILRRVAING